jgi:uncharacterized membrane protein YkgB
MLILGKILFFIGALAIGLYILLKSEYIVREIGHNSSAEKYLGSGGSYTMWKIIGILLIVVGFLFLIGDLDWLLAYFY